MLSLANDPALNSNPILRFPRGHGEDPQHQVRRKSRMKNSNFLPVLLLPLFPFLCEIRSSYGFTPSRHPNQQLRFPVFCAGLSANSINERLENNLKKMKERDRAARVLQKDDITIAFDDNHLIVVDKPSGVLCASNDKEIPSLCKTVYEMIQNPTIEMSQMVVHRLGMDTSGLIVFCKTRKAVKGMNRLFRMRQVSKEYEALVCGVITDNEGIISMPLMRDYEVPPYIRVSTEAHQLALAHLDDVEILPKTLLEPPKPCLTKYTVLAHETLAEGVDVTRIALNSLTGRTHQLNVHMAAFGHPIVADKVYGINGVALPNGGLTEEDLIRDRPHRSSPELQQQIANLTKDWNMCIHATLLSFKHPVTKQDLIIRSSAPF